METTATQRGFSLGKFVDKYGNNCSIQKSSIASEDCIWLGIDKPKLTVFEDSSKGKYIITDMPSNFDVDSRMHLTIEQVKNLLPHLNAFVNTGDIEVGSDSEFSFDEFKIQLHYFIKENYGGCSSFLEPILTVKTKNELKRHFVSYKTEVFDYLGGNPIDENDVKELEGEIRDLQHEISDLKSDLKTKDGALDGTLNSEYKLQHFIQYKNEYTETELEELLKNGKKYLNQ